MTDKTKKILGWVLAGLVAFVFIGSGGFKISGGNAEMVKGLGGATNLLILGSLEVIIAILFLYPRTGVIGALLGIAYMGGAMAVHLVSGQSIMLLVVIEVLIWITSAVRFPELVERLRGAK
ncbi:probable integral membrane protein [Pedobacter sp. BAL39]|uniref:DoxX family protein n=1 Tax=Pedobacter sp. BAL39 TaxID=391596 RepID=UPI0001559D2D|nr:DoxX family protein [Pedobacter sp. BAL39]EDM35847.1 probable integral membrane protein [Pedobacter sp. BAL39]